MKHFNFFPVFYETFIYLPVKRDKMRKDIIKSLIALKQNEIPFDVINRDVKLPINRKKIITVPGVRRCGKSTLMEIAINSLVQGGRAGGSHSMAWVRR